MGLFKRREAWVLLLGDLASFIAALWLSLLLRYVEPPSSDIYFTHLVPFSLLFAAWVVSFYIAGLYEKHTVILQSKLPQVLATTQLTNSGIAVIFFYFIPFFGITPKTILFIYLFISFALVLSWRTYGYFTLGRGKINRAFLIGSGDEMKELWTEVNENPIYNLKFVYSVDLNRADESGFWKEIVEKVYSEDVSVIVIDISNKNVEPVLPHLYNLIFSKINFIDMHKVYEDIFDRVPLSLLKYNWFLENISTTHRTAYDAVKRIMDIFLSLLFFIISLAFYPFIVLAIKLDDGRDIFFRQERMGENNKVFKILKFRSMRDDEVTRAGKILRKTRLDELPQLINVLKGDLSLIGPRPELPRLVKIYSEQIPYYNVRHLIKPGLSGWAQIYHDSHPHHQADTLETKNKLSYDLYYIKNRSMLLDIKIALKTLRTLVSMAGR